MQDAERLADQERVAARAQASTSKVLARVEEQLAEVVAGKLDACDAVTTDFVNKQVTQVSSVAA